VPRIDSLVKVGGGVLAQPALWYRALDAIARAAARERLVVVGGGGPFADTVRVMDERLDLADDAAHWMAILAMEQYAHALAEKLAGAVLVEDAAGIAEALNGGAIPVLAPYRWLRAADPLPHSWDVTSDSIAAWIAGALGATRVVLIKPAGSTGDLVDPYFERALPRGVEVRAVPADRLDELAHLS
jgi:aspartokinase-like uncharacterized kinase